MSQEHTLDKKTGKVSAARGMGSLRVFGRELRVDYLLLVVLLLAASLRLNGLDWGWTDFSPLPKGEAPVATFNNFHPDEASNLRVARNMYESGNWRPTGELYGQKFDYSLYGAAPIYLHIAAHLGKQLLWRFHALRSG